MSPRRKPSFRLCRPRHLGRLPLGLVLLLGASVFASPPDEVFPEVHGLPFNRVYTLAEIGNIPRGARLAFDDKGRIAVINDGAVFVLNDGTWIDIAEKPVGGEPLLQFIREIGGTTYYCAQGSWGTVETNATGRIHPHPAVPENTPKWVPVTNFDEMVEVPGGVLFAGWNGVVHWDRTTGRNRFFPVSQVSHVFRVRDAVFVSSLTDGIQLIDLEQGSMRRVADRSLTGVVVEHEVPLGDGRVLVATAGRRLMVFDGQVASPWANELKKFSMSRIVDMVRLVEGGIALAVEGQGVFILSEHGKVLKSLTATDYRQANAMVANEAGVLWIATEQGVEKVLYDIPAEVIDQRLGIPVIWPQLVRWQDRIVVASNGRLYESDPAPDRPTDTFRPVLGQPPNGVWGIGASGDRLLVANAYGVYSREDDGSFRPVLNDINVDRLVMAGPDLCYVIGAAEITALRWADGRWSEFTPRIPGVGYPALINGTRKSAWIELGPNRVARIGLHDGRLQTRVFESFPWKDSVWVHVSVIDDTVVLSGPPNGRLFFDEETEGLTDAPQLRRLLDSARHWVSRVKRDDEGTLWASHPQGVLKIEPEGDSYSFDRSTLAIIKDRVPVVWVLGGRDVWYSTGYVLYHVNRHPVFTAKPERGAPQLVSMLDGRSGEDLTTLVRSGSDLPHLSYAQNGLTFRFFAGTYAWLQPPGYEFTINGNPIVGADSVLTLPDLREGLYHLEVRLASPGEPGGEVLTVDFAIEPPWYRTWYVGAAAVVLGVLAVIGIVQWFLRRARTRNLALERLVQERTEELRTAMRRLAEETRHAATLAERDRLAGEIHDSLQQGLSGLILQLDATLKLASLAPDVRSRLTVARNMVSFTRLEVQNAVWDLESPLLENDDLGDALRKMSNLIGSGSPRIEMEIRGPSRRLPSSERHHLLRIAQEAITNAVRHGEAGHISVILEYAADSVALLVEDDGRGFNPDQVLTPDFGHFGLRGLRGRADKINGELQITSAPGHGASIRIRVPTPSEEPVNA